MGVCAHADQAVTILDGQTVTISVTADGTQPFTYQWSKDGLALTDGGKVSGSTSGTLTLTNVTSADAGNYTVIVSNSAGSTTSDVAIVSYAGYAPTITQQPASQTVFANDSVSFTAVASGIPTPTFQWYKNGVALTDGGNILGSATATLSVTGVSSADAGTYTVVATNSLGSATSNSATLTVNAGIAPTITTQPASQTANVGATATFAVAASGTPVPAFQWRKNGANLTDGGNIFGAKSDTLTFSNLTSADAATYTVVATNSAGSAISGGATLTVNSGTPPAITTQPASQTANAGAAVSFSVTASGTPAPAFQWQKNGANLADGGNVSGSTTATLTLSNVAGSDAAAYRVVATNANGSATSNNATLTVNTGTPPIITTQPAGQTANAGATVTFTAAASGVPSPTYQWRKNGGNIPGATGASLALTNVTSADAATYSVVASNTAGSATSTGATLTVNTGTPPAVTTQPAGQVANTGATVTFTVAASGTPAPAYQWRKNGSNLSNGGNISGVNTATLTLTNVQSIDAATYSVVASNTAGSAASSDAALTINTGTAPAITTEPASQTVNAGTTITFSVVATGTPAPTYQWRKNGINLSNSGNISGATGAALTLSSVTSADAATYNVVVTNTAGSATSSEAVLTVSTGVAPAIAAQPASQTVFTGANVTFTAAASGSPAPTYQWRKDGVVLGNGGNISGATTATLTLASVAAADAGAYGVVASNTAGDATSSDATLTVNSGIAPVITVQPASQTAINGTTVTFAVSASGTPAPLFQWRKNGVNLSNGGNVSGATSAILTLSGVTAADSATYSVVASNLAGTATSNGAALLTIDPGTVPSITTQPASQLANAGATVSFTVTASGSPAPTYQWRKNGSNLTAGGNVSGTTGTTLTLSNIMAGDAGGYSVVATNSNGSAISNSATLAVNTGTAPVITAHPASQAVEAGATATFTVTASGFPSPTYRWRRNGSNLADSDNIFGATSSVLSITGVVAGDAATYSVVVTNSNGTATSNNATLTVNTTPPGDAPAITTQPAGQAVNVGATVIFTVAASGTPPPTFQWRKNGSNLSDGGNVSGATGATLLLSNVSTADAATYTAVATNTNGTATSLGAALTIDTGTPPVITTQPVSQTVTIGAMATFTATASGTPSPTYRWRKNGSDLSNGGNVSGADSATLTLSSVTSADAATYTLVATNTNGAVTSDGAILTVDTGALPVITTQPSDHADDIGATVSFTLVVSGTPAPTIQWRKNGSNLADGGNVFGATTGTLVLSNITAADAATYTAVVTNTAGSVTSTGAALTVNAGTAPSIMIQPASQAVDLSTAVTFTIAAIGTPSPTYQWRKNGSNLADGGNVAGATTTALALSNVTTADAAAYSVVVSNANGSATSTNAILTINTGTVPLITRQPATQSVLAGATVTFAIAATGAPAPNLQWRKNGVSLTDGGNISGANTAALTLSGVAVADSADYSVVATNSNGSATSNNAKLTVSPGIAPLILLQPAARSASAGAAVTFSVTVGGVPAPTFQWRKDGQNLSDDSRITGTNTATLALNDVSFADSGDYSVFVSNPAGSATSNNAAFAVDPGTAPVIAVNPAGKTALEGATVSFTVVATGAPAPTYQWRKEGVDISGATNATLTLAGITTAEAGTYSVVVANPNGSATSDGALLTVNPGTAPLITMQPASQAADPGTAVAFNVVASGAPAPTYQWRKNGVNLANGGNVSGATADGLILTNISSTDVGVYSVVATNSAGSATSVDAILTVTAGIIPTFTTHPAGQTVNPGTNVTFTVVATGIPAPTIQWQKDGVNLSDGGNVSGVTTDSLVLASVTDADAGSYTAVATNTIGSATSNGATLALSGAPYITSQPPSQAVLAGELLSLGVAASGTPAPSYQWRRNGVNLADNAIISGAKTSTLTLTNVPVEYAGTYAVVAINMAGSVLSLPATVTVYGPPVFNNPPVNETVMAGGSAVFGAIATGVPSPSYQWQKDGVNLVDGGNVSGATTDTLIVTNVSAADAGNYRLVASNFVGVTTTAAAELLVLPATIGNQVVSSGHDAALSFRGAPGSLQWQISTDSGGSWTNLANNGAYSGVTTDTLKITGVSTAQNGTRYRLVSTINGAARVVYDATLTVEQVLLPSPVAITADGQGNLYVADTATNSIKKIVGGTQVATYAGSDGLTGTADGTGSSARFNSPSGLVAATDGTLAVADTANATIRLISSSRAVSTLAGSTTVRGNTDGAGTAATFSSPSGIARDTAGNLYVADSLNHTIRKISASGVVTTLAGTAGTAGDIDGTGAAARFNRPTGIAVDTLGNVYVADTTNNLIRKVTGAGVVTTLAGLSGVSGADDGFGADALFNRPTGLTVDGAGNLFVADTGNSTIRRVSPTGDVRTYAGVPGIAGLKDGIGADAWFNQPQGVSFDSTGILFVADTGNAIVRRVGASGSVTTLTLTVATTTAEPPSVPSTPSTPTTPSVPSTPSTGGGGGGGGGAPSVWFLALLAAAWLVRRRTHSEN